MKSSSRTRVLELELEWHAELNRVEFEPIYVTIESSSIFISRARVRALEVSIELELEYVTTRARLGSISPLAVVSPSVYLLVQR